MGVNWNNLVDQGRAKAYGVPWTEEEHEARAAGIPADYVRNGVLTLEAYEKAKSAHEATGKPQKYLGKKEVQKLASSLGVKYSEETTRAELLEMCEQAREKLTQSA